MITIVLILGVVNLGLGFALAILLERPIALPLAWPAPWARVRAALWARRRRVPKAARSKKPDNDLWAKLRGRGIKPASFVEAVLWTVKFDVLEHRQQLIGAEQQHRNGTAGAIESISSQSGAWRKRLSHFAEALTAVQETGECALSRRVEEALLDHVLEVKTCVEKIEELETQDQSGDEIISQICSLTAADNKLRDFVDEALAGLLRDQERLDQIVDSLQHRPESSTFSRLGMETLFNDWWSRDKDHVRVVSCVLLDLDRFALVNERWGEEIGDRIADAFEDLLADQVRQGRGFDRVARVSGQTYLLFLGDTAYRNASSGAERIRQTIEAASFRVAAENVELTACCGVVEIGKDEQIPEFLARLNACVAEAKKAGRNRTFLDDGSGPQATETPQFQVLSDVIEIECSQTSGAE